MDEPDRLPERGAPLANCELCGELIGVYEPLVVRSPTGWRTTSVAAEPELRVADLACLHLDCATGNLEATA